jgi:hypothetical protein
MNFIGIVWIKKLVYWVVGSPLVASVIGSLIEDFKEQGEEILRVALEAVKECSDLQMKDSARFGFVYQRVRAQIPRASESLINTSIEAALRFYKRG